MGIFDKWFGKKKSTLGNFGDEKKEPSVEDSKQKEEEIPKNFIDMQAKLKKLARKYSNDCEYYHDVIMSKNCDMTVKIISELLLSEQSYFTIEESEERSANYATILYKGTIEDVKSGLNNYYVHAQKEPNFRNYAIQLSYDRWAASSSVIEMLADYNTHMDITQIYKAENNDYYVTGVLPPYQGSLMEYKRYEDYIPKKLYHYE